MAIQAEERDSVSRLYSGGAQCPGQTAHTMAKFSVRKSLLATDDCRLTGKLRFRVAKETQGRQRNIHKIFLPGRLASIAHETAPGSDGAASGERNPPAPFRS